MVFFHVLGLVFVESAIGGTTCVVIKLVKITFLYFGLVSRVIFSLLGG